MDAALKRSNSGFGVIVVTLLLSFNVFSTMLLAELPNGNLANYGVTGLFILSVVLFGLLSRKEVWIGAEWILLIVWLVYAMIPALLSADVESSMFKVLTVLQLAVWALAIQQAIVWRNGSLAPLLMYGAAVTGAYLLSFSGIGVGTIDGNPDAVGRVASTLVNANAFGAAAVMGLSLCLVAAASGLAFQFRIVQILLSLALVVAVVNSGSRTALVGMIFLLLGSSWALRFWNLRQAIRILPSLLVITAVTAAVYFATKDLPAVAERVDGIFSLEDPNSVFSRLWDFIGVIGAGSVQAEEGGESMSQRLDLVFLGLDLLLQSNLIGIGPDNFKVLVGAYSHSNVIEVLVATGVLGILLYYSIYLAFVVRCIGILRIDRFHSGARMALVALATLSLMDIQHVSYDTKQGWLFLAILIGSVEVFRRQVLSARNARIAEMRENLPDAVGVSGARSRQSEQEPGAVEAGSLTALSSIEPSARVDLDINRRATLAPARKLDD